MDRETATKAAKWWSGILNTHHDNGANDKANVMSMLLSDMLADKNAPTKDQITKFEQLLTDELMKLDSTREISLYCDYHPDEILYNAAEAAGINAICFPYKTGMLISGDKIKAKVGYGSSYSEI